jgi:hypothetical protein
MLIRQFLDRHYRNKPITFAHSVAPRAFAPARPAEESFTIQGETQRLRNREEDRMTKLQAYTCAVSSQKASPHAPPLIRD